MQNNPPPPKKSQNSFSCYSVMSADRLEQHFADISPCFFGGGGVAWEAVMLLWSSSMSCLSLYGWDCPCFSFGHLLFPPFIRYMMYNVKGARQMDAWIDSELSGHMLMRMVDKRNLTVSCGHELMTFNGLVR